MLTSWRETGDFQDASGESASTLAQRADEPFAPRELLPIEMDELRRLEKSRWQPRRGRRIGWIAVFAAGLALAWHALGPQDAQAAVAPMSLIAPAGERPA